MRGIGWLHSNEQVPVPADTYCHALLGPGAAVAFDVPAGAGMLRLSGLTSAGLVFNFWANLFSTAAQAPTSSVTAGSTSSTNLNIPIAGAAGGGPGQLFQLGTAGSSVISVAALSSGYVTAEWWHRR